MSFAHSRRVQTAPLPTESLWHGSIYHPRHVLVETTCMGAAIVLSNLYNPGTGSGFRVDTELTTLPDMRAHRFYQWPIDVIETVNRQYEAVIADRHSPAPPSTETEKQCSECEKAKQQQSEQEAGKPECAVCMDAKCCRIFLPCHHICCCSECSKKVTDCPICKTSIQHTHIVYM